MGRKDKPNGPALWDQWRDRLQQYIGELGFSSAMEWGATRPTATYDSLADDAGVAPVHVRFAEAESAAAEQQFERFVRQAFVRDLYEIFPFGWPAVSDPLDRMDLYGMWAGSFDLKTPDEELELLSRWKAFGPPVGWKPTTAADSHIVELIAGLAVIPPQPRKRA